MVKVNSCSCNIDMQDLEEEREEEEKVMRMGEKRSIWIIFSGMYFVLCLCTNKMLIKV